MVVYTSWNVVTSVPKAVANIGEMVQTAPFYAKSARHFYYDVHTVLQCDKYSKYESYAHSEYGTHIEDIWRDKELYDKTGFSCTTLSMAPQRESNMLKIIYNPHSFAKLLHLFSNTLQLVM